MPLNHQVHRNSLQGFKARGRKSGQRQAVALYRAQALVGFLVSCWFLCSTSLAGGIAYDSRHYRIISDLDRQLTLELASRVDIMYEEYARRLADFAPADGAARRFNLYLFARRADYIRLTGARFTNTSGIFMSQDNILAACMDEQGREALCRTLQHEAFHQFAHTNISPNLPIWLEEGLAQVFEEAILIGTRFEIGQVSPQRIRQLRYDFENRRLIPFRTLLAMSREQWQLGLRDQATAATQYNQSWAMAHFLIFQTDGSEPRYRRLLLDWLRRMHRGEDPHESFLACFSDNIEGFQSRFVEFGRSLRPTPLARAIEHQTVLADLLIELRNRGQRFDSVAKFREEIIRGRYRIDYTRGVTQWKTAEDPSIYFADLRGKPYSSEQLRFEPRPGAPLPDLVCRPDGALPLRTRFYPFDGRIERETVVEPPTR